MSLLERAYELALTVARPFIEMVVRTGRYGRAVRGRREALTRLEQWAVRERDRSLPLLWVHAPSAGEALMAQAIIGALRSNTRCQVAFTYFSPSAERVAERVGADVNAYLPWDVQRDVRRTLAVLDPAVLVFIRTEIWPTLVREAKARRVRVTLVNAPLATTSSRLRPLARAMLRRAYGRLDAVGAVSAEDAQRFALLGVDRGRVRVTGDARFDQVVARAAGIDRDSSLLRTLDDPTRPTIIAGSTWPPDERLLAAAYPRLLAARGARLVIAPHEPTESHVRRLEKQLTAASLEHARLSDVEAAKVGLPDVVIVDRVGILADVYAVGRAAYVGGGFGRHGLHSVVEPAAVGLPVAFGPAHGNAREAGSLAQAGGGVVISDADDLVARLMTFLESDEFGHAALKYVESELGGAQRNAALIREQIEAFRSEAGGGRSRVGG